MSSDPKYLCQHCDGPVYMREGRDRETRMLFNQWYCESCGKGVQPHLGKPKITIQAISKITLDALLAHADLMHYIEGLKKDFSKNILVPQKFSKTILNGESLRQIILDDVIGETESDTRLMGKFK